MKKGRNDIILANTIYVDGELTVGTDDASTSLLLYSMS